MINRPVPILYVQHRPDLGGAPASLLHLIKGLDRRRYQPYVLCPAGPVAGLFRNAGLTVYPAPVSTFTHVLDSIYQGTRWGLLAYELIKLPLHWRALRHAIQVTGARVVHLNESNLAAASIIAKQMGCRVVWHVRHFMADGRRRHLIHSLMRRYADAVIVINEDVKRCVEGLPHVHVIHNSVDLAEYRPNDRGDLVRTNLGIPKEELCVGHVGGIHWAKGIFDFIKAVKLLHPDFPSARFLVVGDGAYPRKPLRNVRGRLIEAIGLRQNHAEQAHKMVIQYKLQQAICFVGFLQDLPGLYAALDIVVYPSRLRTVGRPALEAAACGRPVVATSDTGNCDVVVDGVTGLLVPPGSPEALANAIGKLLADANLVQKMGNAGIERARSRFDYRANSQVVMELYDRILARQPGEGHERIGSLRAYNAPRL
jgi:glycosyltransferase involved in cell wall biosynthesis